jgi:hypothetical protein
MVAGIIKSYISSKKYNIPDNIYLIQQYYIPKNAARKAEIVDCLRRNCNIPNLTKIYLLNERIYTDKELGLNAKQMAKIEQININHRMLYKDVFEFVDRMNLSGYIIFSNSDIFLDQNVHNIFSSPLSAEKTFMGQLRFEFDPKVKHLPLNKLFSEYISCSQDTWIYHTNFKPSAGLMHMFNFEFGKPGCDNKIFYIMNIIGYNIINDPFLLRTYHHHRSEDRNYTVTDRLEAPYLQCIPNLPKMYSYEMPNSIEILKIKESINGEKYGFIPENDAIYNYIKSCFDNNKKFIIPRVAGVENNFAYYARTIQGDNVHQYIHHVLNTMKNNAGILVTSNESAKKYSDYYLAAFKNCDVYFDWEKWGNVYGGIAESQNYITDNLCKTKNKIWAFGLDIFHSIHYTPWTHALKGKTILIVSAFIDSYQNQLEHLDKIYGINLFPDCKFKFIKPPQTQGMNDSKEWDVELSSFSNNLDEIIAGCDIALVSAGGYGNLICNLIYEKGVSAIYVGGVLQMYFGVLGTRWERERREILDLYVNDYWIRPSGAERPSNHANVEGACYW